MIVIGVDAHKATHTAAADPDREKLDQQTVKARQGADALLAWAIELGEDVWAIEDCRALRRCRPASGAAGPPKLMAAQRKTARSYSKSDPIDALAIARAAICHCPRPRPGHRPARRSPRRPRPSAPVRRTQTTCTSRRGMNNPNNLERLARKLEHASGRPRREDPRSERDIGTHRAALHPDLHVAPSGMNNPNNLERLARKLQRLPQSDEDLPNVAAN